MFLTELSIKRPVIATVMSLVLVLFGGLIVLSQGSAIAPFIYAIF